MSDNFELEQSLFDQSNQDQQSFNDLTDADLEGVTGGGLLDGAKAGLATVKDSIPGIKNLFKRGSKQSVSEMERLPSIASGDTTKAGKSGWDKKSLAAGGVAGVTTGVVGTSMLGGNNN